MFSSKTKTTLRRWNSAIHRDLGYLFFGMTLIYALSGIALNHLKDWNPSYVRHVKSVNLKGPVSRDALDETAIREILKPSGESENYNKHYFPDEDTLKVYLKGGTMVLNLQTGEGEVERLKKRWLFNQLNFLHYNAPKRAWTFFSDIYCVCLIILAVSGLFILKGKKGIRGRGAYLTLLGLILPAILYWYYA